MKPYCLNKEELSYFIETELRNSIPKDPDDDIDALLESWHIWDTELICLATVFSQYLEKKLKTNDNVSKMLKEIFALPENKSGLYLNVEGFGEEFVRFFLDNPRNLQLTIEEDLGYLREKLGNYDYKKT